MNAAPIVPIVTALRLRAEWDDQFDPSTCNLFEDAADTIADLLEALERIACCKSRAEAMTWARNALAKVRGQ